MSEVLSGIDFWETELKGTQLPDKRYQSNLVKMCHNLSEKPGLSFSAACGPSVRKSANRLFSSKKTMDIQSGHKASTIERCTHHGRLLILEDTTDLNYSGHKATEGLGDLGGRYDSLGLSMHSALAISPSMECLGLIGQHIWAPTTSGRAKPSHAYKIEEKESYKWIRTKQWVNQMCQQYQGDVLVIGDSEGDFYEHLSYSMADNVDLLVRAHHRNRNIVFEGKKVKLEQLADQLDQIGILEVKIKRQKGRKERIAKISIKKAKIVIPPSSSVKKGPNISITVIYAKEILEEGEEVKDPIDWILLTTLEEVESFDQICELIHFYTLRWIIERFHYVLKSGMRVERSQFDNFKRLSEAIKVYSMAAWQLLWLNYIGKAHPQALADEYFDQLEIEILQAHTGKSITTVQDFILSLGSLAGFAKSKAQPLPGEKLLWQSLKLLRAMKLGFQMAKDQSEFYGTG